MSYFAEFIDNKLIDPPKFINSDSVVYEVIVGSKGYGTNNENSDTDLYGVFIPPREMVFPYELRGIDYKYLLHFGTQPEKCLQYNPGNKNDKIIYRGEEFEITVYNIVRYFDLCMECNPNIIESLFAHEDSVITQWGCGSLFRQNRHLFLHLGFYNKFIAYAMSQKNKVTTNKRTGKRKELHDSMGYDSKFLMHSLRLLLEGKQILETGTLDLKKDSELLKSVRSGEIPLDDCLKMFDDLEKQCKILYVNSKLQKQPNEELIKALLLKCLETHWSKNG